MLAWYHTGNMTARSDMSNGPGWGSDWAVGVRVWVERAGRAVLGEGRLELLEAIERWHSISEAARRPTELRPCGPRSGLDSVQRAANNDGMVIPGRVHNGVVILEGGPALPEGTRVTVSCDIVSVSQRPGEKK